MGILNICYGVLQKGWGDGISKGVGILEERGRGLFCRYIRCKEVEQLGFRMTRSKL